MKAECETFRELIALDLYGEAGEDERRSVREHVETCRDCSRAKSALERGLGQRIGTGTPFEGSLARDEDWLRSLREEEPVPAPVRARRVAVAALAIGFAAGILVMACIDQRGPAVSDPTGPPTDEIAIVDTFGEYTVPHHFYPLDLLLRSE